MLDRLQKNCGKFLRTRLPFLQSWAGIAAASLLAASILLFILFFLEPNGTDRYNSDWRTLRLSGYALCVILPNMALHGVDLWLYRRQKQVWTIANALSSRILSVSLMVSASYCYNALVVNSVDISLAEWRYFLLHFGLPYAVLLVPPMIYLELRLVGVEQSHKAHAKPQAIIPKEPSAEADTIISVYGKNNEEQLKIPSTAFLYAEALQNYVAIVFLQDSGAQTSLEKRVFRATLAEICLQIPNAERIHRSYLINPKHLLKIETNKRKRFAHMRHLETPLPVSAERFSD